MGLTILSRTGMALTVLALRATEVLSTQALVAGKAAAAVLTGRTTHILDKKVQFLSRDMFA